MSGAAATRDGEIAALTGLRGFAALWVLLFHVWGAAGPRLMTLSVAGLRLDFTPFFSTGWAGVQVFFVLSGFLLALPYVQWRAGSRSRPQTLPYLARRCARVLPGYYVQLILLLGLVWWQGKPWPINGVGDALGYLAMLMLPEPWGVPLLNGVWWTLPIEFSFYLVVPLLGVLLDRRRGWALLVLSICAMSLWCWWVITDIAAAQRPGARHWLGYQLPGSLDSFGLGMIAALALPLCAALAVAVAALSWHWLEQPVIAWVRRVRARRAR